MTEFSDEATGIYQVINDALLVGDYVEVRGVCMGEEVLVELLTEASAPTEYSGVPLRIYMIAGGPVVVSSSTPSKHEEQEKFVQMGIQKDKPFDLCILAMEDAFKITLNNELVCTHKYLVELEAVQAIGVDGEAVFTDIEFKCIYNEDGYETPRQETPVGFIRMQELRESSMRKKGQPVYISVASPRRPPSPRITSPKPIETPHQPTANILTTHTQNTPEDIPFAMSRSDSNVYKSPVMPEIDSSTVKSSKPNRGIGLLHGRRKSATLDHTPESYYVGSPSGKVIGGDIHPGTYQLLDDEEIASHYRPDSRYNSTTSSQERKSKGRSWFGSRGKKSKSSDTDIFSGEEPQKNGKTKKNSIFSRGKKGSVTPSQSAQSFESLNTISRESMDTDITLRNRSSGREMSTPLYLGVATENDPVRGILPKKIADDPSPEMAAYIAAQRAFPEFENYNLIPVSMEPAHDSRKVRQSRPSSSQYITQLPEEQTTPRVIRTSYVPRDSYAHRESMPPSTRQTSVPRETYSPREAIPQPVRQISIPKDIKGTAPEMAAVIDPHYNCTQNVVDDIRMINEPNIYRLPPTTVYQESVKTVPQPILVQDKVKTVPTTVYHRPMETVPQVIVPRQPAKTLPVRLTRDYYVEDPPQTAAILYDKYHTDRAIAISDGSLLEVENYQPMQPRETIFQKPKIDIDLRSPSPERIPEPVQTHRIHSMPEITVVENVDVSAPVMTKPTHDINRRNSIASVDHLDSGFYLVAGTSTYYLERARSVRGHRSGRSLRRESGHQTRSISRGSSISSFRVGDIAEFRTDRSRKSGQNASEISAWLKSQQQEENIQPVSAGYRMQYTAPLTWYCPPVRSRQRKNDVPLPNKLTLPGHGGLANRQSITLSTLLTADSKTVKLILTTDKGETSVLVLDFTRDRVLFQEGGESNAENVIANEILYIPEQVYKIKIVISYGEEDVLKLYVNTEEVCEVKSTGKRYQTLEATGDLVLISVDVE